MPIAKLSVRQQHRLMDKLEISYRRQVKAAKNKAIKDAAYWYARSGAIPNSVYDNHLSEIQAIYNKNAKRIIEAFGRLTITQLKSINAHLEIKALDEGLFEDIEAEYAARNTYTRSRFIADTTGKDIQRAVTNGIIAQQTTAEIAKDILAVTVISRFRAEAVARTETHAAAMYASHSVAETAAEETGLELKKQWIAVEDERTREAHSQADGNVVDLDEMFDVGGEYMEAPGDPSASAENTINCRCVLGYQEA